MPIFQGKIAIVTGSSSGLGAAIAHKFAKEGCALVLTGRDAKNVDKVKAQCIEAGAKEAHLRCVVGDITSDAIQQQLVDAAKQLGGLDVLVNNAGVSDVASCAKGDIKSFDFMWSINTRAMITMTHVALPLLKERKGCVVNISSTAGLRPNIDTGMYAVTKAAVNQFTKCLALELGPEGIRVNSVNPAAVKTPIFQRATGLSDDACDKMMDMFSTRYPIGRTGQPFEVAEAVAFLSDSAKAGWITGELMVLDGGITLTNASGVGKSSSAQMTSIRSMVDGAAKEKVSK